MPNESIIVVGWFISLSYRRLPRFLKQHNIIIIIIIIVNESIDRNRYSTAATVLVANCRAEWKRSTHRRRYLLVGSFVRTRDTDTSAWCFCFWRQTLITVLLSLTSDSGFESFHDWGYGLQTSQKLLQFSWGFRINQSTRVSGTDSDG